MVNLTNFHRDEIRHIVQNKAVISDKMTNAHVLPHLAVSVLVTNGIILGQGQSPKVLERAVLGHGVGFGSLIIAVVFALSAL